MGGGAAGDPARRAGPGLRGQKVDPHWWYISHIPYEVEDQFGKLLGKDLPVNENWPARGLSSAA